MPILTRDIPASAEGKFDCPECKKKGISTSYNDHAHLGIHRRNAHHIAGTAHTPFRTPKGKIVKRGRPLGTKTGLTITEFVRLGKLRDRGLSQTQMAAKMGRSLATIQRNLTKLTTQEKANGIARSEPQERIEAAAGQPDYYQERLVYFFGRTEKEAELFAEANGIPFQIFAQGMAELFQLQAGGRLLGRRHSVSTLRGQTAPGT